jgi:tetratricopeptide (TPR) repeat protein
MKTPMKKLALFVLIALMSTPVLTAQMGVPTESMGGHIKSPEEKALEAYARGVKAMQKAAEEKDHDKQMKLYTRAKDEFSRSVGFKGHYDGYLALGQAFLALGNRKSALEACNQAQSMKTGSAEAQSCVLQAQKAPESSETRPAGGGGR